MVKFFVLTIINKVSIEDTQGLKKNVCRNTPWGKWELERKQKNNSVLAVRKMPTLQRRFWHWLKYRKFQSRVC